MLSTCESGSWLSTVIPLGYGCRWRSIFKRRDDNVCVASKHCQQIQSFYDTRRFQIFPIKIRNHHSTRKQAHTEMKKQRCCCCLFPKFSNWPSNNLSHKLFFQYPEYFKSDTGIEFCGNKERIIKRILRSSSFLREFFFKVFRHFVIGNLSIRGKSLYLE